LLIESKGLSAQQTVKVLGFANFTIDFLESEMEMERALLISDKLKSD
jgi:hypothetical protein